LTPHWRKGNYDAVWGGLILLGLIVLVYFIPMYVAYYRGHPNAMAIFALNLLLGWTFIGWVIALVWALTAVDKPRT
jgi:ABC-type transport system involved in cytochrome c biogenesis permease component